MSANDDKRNMSENGDTDIVRADARLPGDAAGIRAAIDDLKAFQATHTLEGLSVCEMIKEGRKH